MSNQLRIQFKRLLLSVFAVLFLISGCFHNPASINIPGSQYKYFSLIWEEYETNYPEFTMKDVDWKEVFYKYAPLAEQVETTEELAYQVLQPMLAEMMDHHAYIRTPDGTYILPYPLEYFRNFEDSILMENYLLPAGFTGSYDEFGYCDPEILPYLAVNAWNLADEMGTIGDYLEECAEKPAIILDMRNNPGGPVYYVPLLAGFFTNISVRAGYRRRRRGPGYDDVVHEPQYIYSNSSVFYSGKVYLLIGEFAVSSTEIFALYMKYFDNVILLGDTTPGLGCAISTIEFSDGWTIPKFEWSARGLDFEPLEWYGVTPDICIEVTEADFAQGIDPVLEYAIELLESHSL